MLKRILKLAALFVLVTLGAGAGVYLTFIFLVASEETVLVPDITGQNVAYGLEVLTGLGLSSRVKASDYSAEVPKYHVIWQDPEPGERIKKGRSVSIIISKGKKEVLMPDLQGMTMDQARIVLEENGLVCGILSETHASDIQAGAILAQRPASGVTVVRESPVDLLVSLGKWPIAYVMPDMAGLSLAEAIGRMEKMGLLAGEIRFEVKDTAPMDTVVGQTPDPGTRVLGESRIDLVINRPEAGADPRLLQGGGGVRVFRHRLANGFINRHINVKLNFLGASFDLVDDYREPGSDVWAFIPAHRDVTVLVYEDATLVRTEVFGSW